GHNADFTGKVKLSDDTNGKVTLDLQRLGVIVGYAFPTRVSIGVIHSSNEYDQKVSAEGASTAKGSQQASETQASIAYFTDDYEVAVLYEPTISFSEDDISYERPASFTVDYFRKLSGSTK